MKIYSENPPSPKATDGQSKKAMKIYSENKKATFDYNILEKFEGGLVLFGQEVKSIRTGHINLSGSYVSLAKGEPYLIGVKISPYQPNNAGADYNDEREKKVLLNKKEINYLLGKSKNKGSALIPLKIYDNNGRIKLKFGLAQGKRKYDKKEKIKKRDMDRELNREISR